MGFRRGKAFERETAALAGKRGKRVPLSGALGTTAGISSLAGDVTWNLPWFNHGRGLQIECKHGYEGAKGTNCALCGKKLDKPIENTASMTIYRKWFDKHMEQGEDLGFYPIFAMKFKLARDSKFILIPFTTMEKMLKEMEDVWLELEEFRDNEKKSRARKGKV